MAPKETHFGNELWAIGSIKQQVSLLQKKVWGNEIDASIMGNHHLPVFQVPHCKKADGP